MPYRYDRVHVMMLSFEVHVDRIMREPRILT